MTSPEPQHAPQPDVVAAMRGDLADWRQWLARIVVLAYAAAAGLSVVGFNELCEFAQRGFAAVRALHPWAPLAWTTACTAGVVWLTRRFAPGCAGSGIPQVMAALDPELPTGARFGFASLRLSAWKAVLTAGAILAGLASGREGPSVQIAAGVMQHARRWLPLISGTDGRTRGHPGAPAGGSDHGLIQAHKRPLGISEHGLLVAGGAAGIAAAFNAPLAGVMFAIEELARTLEQRSSGLIIAAIVLAGLMGVSFFGNATYFGTIAVPPLHYGLWWPALLLVLACGALGGVFARLLHASITGSGDGISRWRAAHPAAFAGACGLAAGVIGVVSQGATFGSGYDYTKALLAGQLDVPLLYVTLRVVATWLAVWSGVPGGIFAPCLAIGAGLGHDVAAFTGASTDASALIALGMAGFLAAVTQAPMTAFIIVMEMVGGHAMVLSLMAAALGASLVSRWVARPLYTSLALVIVARTRAAAPAGGA